MGTSVVPALIDALIVNATQELNTNREATVTDGWENTGGTGDFLMIGIDDPDDARASESASSEQDWAHVNHTARDEEGSITCLALSSNKNRTGGPKAARDGVYAITATLEQMLRAAPDQGVTGVLWTGFGSSSQLHQAHDKSGAVAWLVFRIHFRARI